MSCCIVWFIVIKSVYFNILKRNQTEKNEKDVCLNFIFPLKSILILGGTRKLSFQVGISRVVGPEILGGTLNPPPAHYT